MPKARPVIFADAAKASGSDKSMLTTVATSNLVFLPAVEYSRPRNYADVSGKRQEQYQSIFQPLVAG